jgi:MFS family permease
MKSQAGHTGLRTTALCAGVQAIGGGLGWSAVPALMPTISRDLGISHAMGGVVWGAASLGIALASPFGGAAVDRFGPRKVASAALAFGALACAARALVHGPWGLAATMLAFGAHIGFTAPAIPKALAAEVEPSKLARANGLALLGYTLGTALTVLVAGAWLAPALGGWRPTMVLAAVAMLGAAVAWGTLLTDRRVAFKHAGLRATFALARNGALLRIAAMHFLLFGGYLALLGMLPRLLVERGMPLSRVGIAVATWLACAGIANVVGPAISDRLRRRRVVLVGGAAVAGLALAGFAAAPASSALACLSIAALGGGCVAPLLFAMPAELEGVGPARVGAALGLLMLVGQMGGFVLPMVAGVVAQSGNVTAALAFLAVVHLAILVPASGVVDGRDVEREPLAART